MANYIPSYYKELNSLYLGGVIKSAFLASKINFGLQHPAKGVQNLFWAVRSPKFILGGSESKIYFGWLLPMHF